MKGIIASTMVLLLFSCDKSKNYVPADVAVFVKHHGELIPGAKVYVKYNAAEFPGEDVTVYDKSATCGTDGHAKGHTHFEGLEAGDYYFYSTGYDSTVMDDVMGGIKLTIAGSEEKQELTLDIPVTE